MNDDRSLERAARSWVELGPTEAPEHAVERALLLIETTPQERDWHVPWRLPTMTTPARVAATAVIGVLVVGGALFVLRPGDSSVGGSSPTPKQTSSPAISPAPSPSPSTRGTVVEAPAFVAPFRMTWDVPVRPQVKANVVDIFMSTGGMNVFRVDLVGRDPCLTNDLLDAPLQTPQEFMDWLGTIPRTTVEQISPITIDGHNGLERIVTVGDLTGCIDTGNLHSGIVTPESGPGGYYMTAGERERWVALDVDGRLIAIVVWPSQDQGVAAAADRALMTMDFSPAP